MVDTYDYNVDLGARYALQHDYMISMMDSVHAGNSNPYCICPIHRQECQDYDRAHHIHIYTTTFHSLVSNAESGAEFFMRGWISLNLGCLELPINSNITDSLVDTNTPDCRIL